MFDYLIVGAGLYGATIARCLLDRGKRVLVVDRRNTIGGNAYTEEVAGIHVHKYGAHIFHTEREDVWRFVNRFAEFNNYLHTVQAEANGRRYSLPFNMKTFEALWGVTDPAEAEAILRAQGGRRPEVEAENLEEQAICLVGQEVYETLIRGYTEKQWGRSCRDLPAFIIRRLPVRMAYDDRYFSAPYQGIPRGGYTAMVSRMLEGAEVKTGIDYLTERNALDAMAETVVYSGPIDAFFSYRLGELEYRSLRFEEQLLPVADHQGCAVLNAADRSVPWMRTIEHKWFTSEDEETIRREQTVITREYSCAWERGREAFYPVNDAKNQELYRAYRALLPASGRYVIGGRLGDYRYYDMDAVIGSALETASELLAEKR